ncbi:winged helix-turn-helix domain-containing protein [Streptomyces sp. NPDC001880]
MRERVRLQAVERFESGQKNREIAAAFRVSERYVERWRRQWRERGEAGVLSKGSPGQPRLSDPQIARLARELERGPLVHGWADQRWTLARIKTLIGRLFQVSYAVEGTWRLLRRHGWSWQQPVRRAIERVDAAAREELGTQGLHASGPGARSGLGPGVYGRADLLQAREAVADVLLGPGVPGPQGRAEGDRLARPAGPAGQGAHPARRPDRARVGQPAYAPGQADARFHADHADWLTVFQLPHYSTDLNPQEGIWSLVKRDIGNLAAADLGQITSAVKHKLKQIQYRPDPVDGCHAGTDLIMDG